MPIHFGQVGLWGGEVDPTRRAIVHTKNLLHLWKSHWRSGWPYMEIHLIVNNFMMLTSNTFSQDQKTSLVPKSNCLIFAFCDQHG
jgi:hypothetical protein